MDTLTNYWTCSQPEKNSRLRRRKLKPTLSPKDEKLIYYILLVFFLAAAAAGIVLRALDIHLTGKIPACVFYKMTGFYCPGCGGTHAVDALLSLHPVRSFLYHPLVLYTAVFGGWYVLSHTIEYLSKGRYAIGMRYRDIYLYAALVLLILNWLIRNLLLAFCGIHIY